MTFGLNFYHELLFCKKSCPQKFCKIHRKTQVERYFPVNFAKFLRKRFLRNTSGRLLLKQLFESLEENKNRPLPSPAVM